MEFADLLSVVGNAPVFDSSILLAGAVRVAEVQRQLSRWTRDGKLLQLRRGVYALAPPYQRLVPEPFLVANRLHAPSYVSCASALAFHGLLPESVPTTTSVTTGRPASYDTPLGTYRYHHVQRHLFFGYEDVSLARGQTAFVAAPEKALLDQVHLQAGGDKPAYLSALRLQNLDTLNLTRLDALAQRAGTPKMRRAAQQIRELAAAEREAFHPL